MKRNIALAALVLVASLVPMAAASTVTQSQTTTQSTAQADAEAYSGSHVSFTSNGSAVTNYAIAGETVASTIEVQSQSEVRSNLGLGVRGDMDAMTSIRGAGLTMQSSASAQASIQANSGARIQAHDHSHGTLVVEAEDSQYVALGLNASSEAETESNQRVLVTTDSGTTAAVMVVGEGNVTVNDEGNVTAAVESESRLIVRSYSEARTEDDEETEDLIVNGTAAAEVYVDEQDNEHVTGSVVYDANTSVTVDAESESSVNMTIDRSEHEGKVVIASASQFDAESTEDVTVRVDGEVAAAASSYSELRAASDNGSTSKYMVRNSASAEADVLVAVNHFSERTVSMAEKQADDGTSDSTDGDDSDTSDSTDGDSNGGVNTTSGNGPGFGVVSVLAAVVGLTGRAVYRKQ